MPSSEIFQILRIDTPTLLRLNAGPGHGGLRSIPGFQNDVQQMVFSPQIFTHAYTLLGSYPQRFGTDLSLYLKTVEAFFDRSGNSGAISLSSITSSDARRRLSEDLGVSLSSLFMTMAFGVAWETIAQIPVNNALSKKRPDFLGFTNAGDRLIFEAKGTSQIKAVESAVSRAEKQVKDYNVAAECKLAIVSYLCSDDRLFPSATFVIDPPGIPSLVAGDSLSAQLLHFEKILEFIGLPETAQAFLEALALKWKMQAGDSRLRSRLASKVEKSLESVGEAFEDESVRVKLDTRTIKNIGFRGRGINDSERNLFLGVEESVLKHGLNLDISTPLQSFQDDDGRDLTSIQADGTILQIGHK